MKSFILSQILKVLLEIHRSDKLLIHIDELIEHLHIPRSTLMKYLSELEVMNLIEVRGENLIIKKSNVELAYYAVSMGADIEDVAFSLDWRDFEKFTAKCLEDNEYDVIEHFIFKSLKRRYEVDVLGIKRPLIIVIDCKHWRMRSHRSSKLKRAVKEHKRRTEALANNLLSLKGKLGISRWKEAILIPLLVTLYNERLMVYEQVPLVSIYKLNSFLQEVWKALDYLFTKRILLESLF